MSEDTLLANASVAGQPLTFTCAPPGAGLRIALDRDEDGTWDTDERDAGSDPANHASFPGVCGDGLDNDRNGTVDAEDPGCGDLLGLAENPACQDEIDNDGDGPFDYPEDPDCEDATGSVEFVPEPGVGAQVFIALATLVLLRRRQPVVTFDAFALPVVWDY